MRVVFQSRNSRRADRIQFRKMDRCCSREDPPPFRNHTRYTILDSPSVALHLEVSEIVCISVTTPGFLECCPLRGQCSARNGLEVCSYHALVIYHAVCVCGRIEPHDVSASPAAALMHVGRFRFNPERVRHCFVLSDICSPKFPSMIRVMECQFQSACEPARIRHDPKAGSYHS